MHFVIEGVSKLVIIIITFGGLLLGVIAYSGSVLLSRLSLPSVARY